jgi:hypothetical protein
MGITASSWRRKARLARGSCHESVISSTGAPGWCRLSQVAVRLAFSQVVRAQESPFTRWGSTPNATSRSAVAR